MNVLSTDLPSVMSKASTSVERARAGCAERVTAARRSRRAWHCSGRWLTAPDHRRSGKESCRGLPIHRLERDGRRRGSRGDRSVGRRGRGRGRGGGRFAARAAATTGAGGRMPAPAVRRTMSDTTRRPALYGRVGDGLVRREWPWPHVCREEVDVHDQRAYPCTRTTFRSPAAPRPGCESTTNGMLGTVSCWILGQSFRPGECLRGWALRPGRTQRCGEDFARLGIPKVPIPLGSIPSRYPRSHATVPGHVRCRRRH